MSHWCTRATGSSGCFEQWLPTTGSRKERKKKKKKKTSRRHLDVPHGLDYIAYELYETQVFNCFHEAGAPCFRMIRHKSMKFRGKHAAENLFAGKEKCFVVEECNPDYISERSAL